MSTTHHLNGQQLAIDRATPKDKGPSGQAQMAARFAAQQANRGCAVHGCKSTLAGTCSES